MTIPPRDRLLADVRQWAAPALLDAATGLLVGGALDQPDRDLLLARWRPATGNGQRNGQR
jgi:hypothetical protein